MFSESSLGASCSVKVEILQLYRIIEMFHFACCDFEFFPFPFRFKSLCETSLGFVCSYTLNNNVKLFVTTNLFRRTCSPSFNSVANNHLIRPNSSSVKRVMRTPRSNTSTLLLTLNVLVLLFFVVISTTGLLCSAWSLLHDWYCEWKLYFGWNASSVVALVELPIIGMTTYFR